MEVLPRLGSAQVGHAAHGEERDAGARGHLRQRRRLHVCAHGLGEEFARAPHVGGRDEGAPREHLPGAQARRARRRRRPRQGRRADLGRAGEQPRVPLEEGGLAGRLAVGVAEGGGVGVGVGQGGRDAHVPDLDRPSQPPGGARGDHGVGLNPGQDRGERAGRRDQPDTAAHQDQLAPVVARQPQGPGLGAPEQRDGLGVGPLGQCVQEGPGLLGHGAGDDGGDAAGGTRRTHAGEPTPGEPRPARSVRAEPSR